MHDEITTALKIARHHGCGRLYRHILAERICAGIYLFFLAWFKHRSGNHTWEAETVEPSQAQSHLHILLTHPISLRCHPPPPSMLYYISSVPTISAQSQPSAMAHGCLEVPVSPTLAPASCTSWSFHLFWWRIGRCEIEILFLTTKLVLLDYEKSISLLQVMPFPFLKWWHVMFLSKCNWVWEREFDNLVSLTRITCYCPFLRYK